MINFLVLSQRMPLKEQAHFAKRLAFLVGAGLPLLECLRIVHSQERRAHRAKVYGSLADDVERGQFLSTSLERQKRFSPLMVELVRVGEHGGLLGENLAYLADELAKRQALRRKVLGALIYPAFVTLATVGLVSLMSTYIVPKLLPVFAGLHAQLPVSTRLLIATSGYLRSWGLLTLVVLVVLAALLAYARNKYERMRLFLDRALLRAPFAGPMVRSYNLSTACRTLGLLLRAGVPLSLAAQFAARATHNGAYREALTRAAGAVPRGERLSSALMREKNLFPDLMLHLTGIGELSGNLSGTLMHLAAHYESEVEETSKNLSSAMEPALMLVMGGLVGFVAVSVISPIYGITQHLTPR